MTKKKINETREKVAEIMQQINELKSIFDEYRDGDNVYMWCYSGCDAALDELVEIDDSLLEEFQK